MSLSLVENLIDVLSPTISPEVSNPFFHLKKLFPIFLSSFSNEFLDFCLVVHIPENHIEDN